MISIVQAVVDSWNQWKKDLNESLIPQSISDFLPGLLPGALPPIATRTLGALLSLPDILRGRVGGVLVNLILPLLLSDPKMHQKVIPLDRVVTALGAEFAKEILSFGAASSDLITAYETKKIFSPLSSIKNWVAFVKKPSGGTYQAIIAGPLAALIGQVIYYVLLVGAIIGSIFVIYELQTKVEGLLAQALSQSHPRKRTLDLVNKRL